MEKATAYLSKLEADRMAATALSKEKALEAMLIKAREEGFRAAMEIFGPNVASNNNDVKSSEHHKRKRRDIRQMIIKELSYSGEAMTKQQIAKAIDYFPERTEMVLKRLESEGKNNSKSGRSLGSYRYLKRTLLCPPFQVAGV
jgi:hypothetical protein